MKTFFALIVVLIPLMGSGQTFPVDTIFKNGNLDERINLVFLSDGYQSSEMTKYITDVNKILTDLFAQSPFKEYKNYFNAFAIKVPSSQSGATHPKTSSDSDCTHPALSVNTYFGSSFDFNGIHRLLVPTNGSAVGSVLASNFPAYDQPFVVVNSPYYGGSGGFYSTSSTHSSASEVSIHEIGHSFAFLADEYWAGAQYAAERPNMTQENNTQLVKWKKWMNTNGIGIYAYSESPDWFRPHQNCKMRYLGVPFCSVCKETFVERIHSMVSPLVSALPPSGDLGTPDTDLQFSVTLIKPSPNTMKITWKRNGAEIKKYKDAEILNLPLHQLTFGENIVEAQVIDTTSLSRSDAHKSDHLYLVTWTLNSDAVTGVEVKSAAVEFKFSSYPNPIDDDLNFYYTLSAPADVKIDIIDGAGKTAANIADEKQNPGKYDYHLTSSETGMKKSGLYLLKININGSVISRKLIKP